MAEIKHLLHINAPASEVFKAITEETGLKNWWTDDTVAKPEVGAVIEFNFGERYHDEMKVTKLIPDQRVEWLCLVGEPEWIEVNNDKLEGIFKAVPDRQDLTSEINENLIVELYSK